GRRVRGRPALGALAGRAGASVRRGGHRQRLRPCERAGRDRAQAPEHVGRPRSVRLSDAALTTEWARLLLGMLAQSGVREAVISPGSRSTPFTFAALREPTLRCHDIVDERSAAFFALGQAKVSGEPTLLLCT